VALYVPEGRRRRRILVASAAALLLGLVVGGAVGRLSAPSIDDRVAEVRTDAQQTTAGLRVIALHDQAGTGSGGTDLVLRRTRQELQTEFDKAPWLSRATRTSLLAQLDALDARTDSGSAAFGNAAEALARAIDLAFAS
jgi:hypothetical protein